MSALRPFWGVSFVLSLVALANVALAQNKPLAKVPGPGEHNPAHETVELFKGMESGQLEVKFIPRDEKQGRILLANKAGKPINVQLPETFGAVPVLAQFGPFQQQGQQGQQQQQMIPQPLGGPGIPQGSQQGQGQQQQPPPFFMNIPAEQQRDIKVKTVCLAQGRPNPRPAIPYKLVPLAQVSSDPLLDSVIREYGNGKYSQNVAQAAAWHTVDNMSWEKLAKIDGSMVAIGVNDPYFTKQDLENAKAMVAAAEKNVKRPAAPTVPVTSANVSSYGTAPTAKQKLPPKK